MLKETYTKPPVDIFDVLHAAEAAGVKVPKCVDDWWQKETVLTIEAKDKTETKE